MIISLERENWTEVVRKIELTEKARESFHKLMGNFLHTPYQGTLIEDPEILEIKSLINGVNFAGANYQIVCVDKEVYLKKEA